MKDNNNLRSDLLMMKCNVGDSDQFPVLLTWFNFNPNMDK